MTGPLGPGPQPPGPQSPAPQGPGPQGPGPQSPGPQSPGAQSPGPQGPGPQGGDPAAVRRAPRQREQDPAAVMPEPDDAVTEAITVPLASPTARDTTTPPRPPTAADPPGELGAPAALAQPGGGGYDPAADAARPGLPRPPEAQPAPSPAAPSAPAPSKPAPSAPSPATPPPVAADPAGSGERGAGRELVPAGAGIGGPSPAHRHPRETSRRQWWMKAVAVALCGLLGLSLAAQLRRNEREGALAGARQEDLVRILDELDSRERRLQQEINELQERRRTLSSAAEGSQTVQEELERRAEDLGILAGTVAAEGTGLRLVFTPGERPLTADVILNAVEELRGAGAEAMQIGGRGGRPVRIVASTAFLDTDDEHLMVGGRELTGPYTLLAIGDPETMRAALAIPGGVEDAVRDAGGTVLIDAPDRVDVDATLSAASPEYAEPVD